MTVQKANNDPSTFGNIHHLPEMFAPSEMSSICLKFNPAASANKVKYTPFVTDSILGSESLLLLEPSMNVVWSKLCRFV